MSNGPTKQFSLRDILTVTTGRLLTKPKGPNDNGIGNLYELLNWMTNDDLFTHQLPRASRECKPWLLRWFPVLEVADREMPMLDAMLEEYSPAECCERWAEFLVETCGCKPTYEVPRIPRDDHDVIDPCEELLEMRGSGARVIVACDEKGGA